MSDAQAEIERSIREQLDAGYPETWRWDEDGHEVIGTAVRKETALTENGPCDILVLNVKGKLRSVWLMHTALVSKLTRMRPKVGDYVGIRWLGEREPKGGGRSYYDYNVVVHGTEPNAALDWDKPAGALGSGEAVEAEVVSDGNYGPPPTDEEYAPTDWSS